MYRIRVDTVLFTVDLLLKPNNIPSEEDTNEKVTDSADIGDLSLRNLRRVALVAEIQIILIVILK